jgi:hypothetical protein
MADSLGLSDDSPIVAVLAYSLWFILGGSLLGTLGFYGIIYLKKREQDS